MIYDLLILSLTQVNAIMISEKKIEFFFSLTFEALLLAPVECFIDVQI